MKTKTTDKLAFPLPNGNTMQIPLGDKVALSQWTALALRDWECDGHAMVFIMKHLIQTLGHEGASKNVQAAFSAAETAATSEALHNLFDDFIERFDKEVSA